MACEVAAERSLSHAFATKGIADIEAAMMKFVNGRNLATEDIRNLYNSLSGNKIQDQPFWQKFKESSARRNRIMHAQRLATKQEAEDGYAACSGLVEYLKK